MIDAAVTMTSIDGIIATIPQTRPAIAIPFPPAFVARAIPPRITARSPHTIPIKPKQLEQSEMMPSTIAAIERPELFCAGIC